MTQATLVSGLPAAFLRRLRARAYAEDCRALVATMPGRWRDVLLAKCLGGTWLEVAAAARAKESTVRVWAHRGFGHLGVGSLPEAAVILEKAGLLDLQKAADGPFRVVLRHAAFSKSPVQHCNMAATCTPVAGQSATQHGSV